MRARLIAASLILGCLSLTMTSCAAPAPPLATNTGEAPVYRLAAGDKLHITVFGEEALSKDYVVTTAGDISFPLLGDLPVAGKTTGDLTNMITSQLSQGYLNDPRVNIEVLNFRPFYILGEVSRSGEYPYAPDMTVMQAVALAGGFTYRAQKHEVYIRRADTEQEMTYSLDTGRPVFILPGDTIRVGERYF